ncbi:hypothetical protein [Lysobacter solisilvae (ex Woo and Kim 2020)]|uniref:Uncharacterized protein n=1 Tax=Agrilutibacter terrestris TaxID=2865112 RepID=A0A7H0FX34_9GAMM|nr:hypothetical protein [Lysobacter terrestris]QNP40600.1 hypothetical protein H8B22_14220 [Lysobacter terrestris]
MNDQSTQADRATVAASLQQAYDLNLKVTLLPSRKIPPVFHLGCQPRQGAQRQDKSPLDLPEPIRRWLVEASPQLVAWMSRDVTNAQAFLLDPMAAMQEAGLKLDREQAKTLVRIRETAAAGDAVAPGMQLRTVRVATGKGQPKPPSADWTPPPVREGDDGGDDRDCGCHNGRD